METKKFGIWALVLGLLFVTGLFNACSDDETGKEEEKSGIGESCTTTDDCENGLTCEDLICVQGDTTDDDDDTTDDDDDTTDDDDDTTDDDDDTTDDDDDTTDDDDDDTTDDDDDTTDDDDDDDTTPDGTWHDSVSGLTWQNPPADSIMNWAGADTYCSNLTLADHDDWRLPTIGESRSLIRGCSETVTGGSCTVQDDGCLDWSCREDCSGCAQHEGPADGCYWPDGLEGDCDWYWSSTLVEGDSGAVWHVGYDYGKVGSILMANFYPVRCVR